MKLSKKTILILGALLVGGALLYGTKVYNHLVGLDEGVTNAWSNVETQGQRRLDLIPNLVTTVKAYAQHEKETFEAVVEARAKATQVSIDPTQLTAEGIQHFDEAQTLLSGAISRLIAVSEAYPELKASENFLALQSQLEGTENRIAVARRDFNKQVNTYNSYVRTFPTNVIGRLLGFQKKDYFASALGASEAVSVEL